MLYGRLPTHATTRRAKAATMPKAVAVRCREITCYNMHCGDEQAPRWHDPSRSKNGRHHRVDIACHVPDMASRMEQFVRHHAADNDVRLGTTLASRSASHREAETNGHHTHTHTHGDTSVDHPGKRTTRAREHPTPRFGAPVDRDGDRCPPPRGRRQRDAASLEVLGLAEVQQHEVPRLVHGGVGAHEAHHGPGHGVHGGCGRDGAPRDRRRPEGRPGEGHGGHAPGFVDGAQREDALGRGPLLDHPHKGRGPRGGARQSGQPATAVPHRGVR